MRHTTRTAHRSAWMNSQYSYMEKNTNQYLRPPATWNDMTMSMGGSDNVREYYRLITEFDINDVARALLAGRITQESRQRLQCDCPNLCTTAHIELDKILFVGKERSENAKFRAKHQEKHYCHICGSEIKILSRHFTKGIPKYCPKCRCKSGNHKWQKIRSQGYLLISDVTKKLGFTVKVAYRLTKNIPSKKIEGVKVFREEDVEELKTN